MFLILKKKSSIKISVLKNMIWNFKNRKSQNFNLKKLKF